MTAEIAILNRSALALAADSAVTIRMGNKVKIYDSAEKLFELSRVRPIALMIYNNVEFVGVPLDVAIRKFRSESDRNWQTIDHIPTEFQIYLEQFSHSDQDELDFLRGVLSGTLASINTKLTALLRAQFRKSSVGSGRLPKGLDAKKELKTIILRETADLESNPLTGYLSDKSQNDFDGKFGNVVREMSARAFPLVEPDDEIFGLLNVYVFALLKSNRRTDLFTGLVFGGFGAKDLFPTMVTVDIDGVFFGKLRALSRDVIDIDRRGPRAAIVPFAQQEMAERFIDGLDSQLENNLSIYVDGVVDSILNRRPRSFSKAERDSIKQEVSANFVKVIEQLKQKSRSSVLDIVYSMSKKELAEMAHALVELTSKKRRFSSDQETVGGPIDVAIVTRNEGLIWIQRKHYFDPALNLSFQTRMAARRDGGLNGK
ncbi:hypothetical protein [Aestuariivirga sp.]|uniref:hypothetical protein n=1 Tax=Aestuariivirga sp. TaxID=2650926 RepID=UPI0039E406FE